MVRSIEELLAIRETQLVVIATPNDTHAPLARACLEAGRDVVVDKPFTTTMAEAQELVELANKLGRLITVYQNRRYDGDFQAIRQMVADQTLGDIVRFETNYDRFRPEFESGTAQWTPQAPEFCLIFAPHLIDHALVLFGLPQAVTAACAVELPRAWWTMRLM